MATWRRISETPTNDRGPLPPHAQVPSRRGLRALERLLLIIGFGCLGYFVYVSLETALYQAYETRELDAILTSAPPTEPAPPLTPAKPPAPTVISPGTLPRPATGTMIGRIEIPRLHVSAIIRAGSDARTLRLAVGHIGGTALPGEHGNIGLAAHRDTFFRRLGDIRENDQVRLVTQRGTFSYRVMGTQIVRPRDTWVLNQTGEQVLTLITCYPFRYVGSAPKRFIVRAEFVS